MSLLWPLHWNCCKAQPSLNCPHLFLAHFQTFHIVHEVYNMHMRNTCLCTKQSYRHAVAQGHLFTHWPRKSLPTLCLLVNIPSHIYTLQHIRLSVQFTSTKENIHNRRNAYHTYKTQACAHMSTHKPWSDIFARTLMKHKSSAPSSLPWFLVYGHPSDTSSLPQIENLYERSARSDSSSNTRSSL